MRIRFENQYGSFVLSGNGDEIFGVKEIEGLGLPDITLNTVQYAGQEGRETVSATRNYRTITISGDIKWQDKDREVRKAMKILSAPVEVTIYVGNRKRRCSCRCTSFAPPFGKKIYKEFVMQLECDSPYFLDGESTKEKVYHREKYLPLDYGSYFGTGEKVISALVQSNHVSNNGDVRAEPSIYIQNTGGTAASGDGIVIHNETTGQSITLCYQTKKDELVTIDIANRKIYNNSGETLVNYLSDNSYLSDFWLEEGDNLISVETNSTAETVVVSCEFYNQYLEAYQ